ncbi:MAG: phosphoribosylformylglycinamidine synthase I [Verrucomicrobiota bacterium]
MEKRPHALLLKFPGTNCDAETARALREVGFSADVLPISQVDPSKLEGVDLVVLSGGFSYGDYVMAGRLAQLVSENRLGDSLKQFRDAGGYLLGICNGFQILTRMGLLPEGSLIHNDSGRFKCNWVKLKKGSQKDSPFLRGLPDEFELPIAHAEGRFVTKDASEAEALVASGLGVLTYAEDINGSFSQIAGIQDESGRVLGLMPHPERFMSKDHHYDPDWKNEAGGEHGTGYYMFQSIFEEISKR